MERYTADLNARDELFDDVMVAELRRWIELADDRTAKYNIETYVIAGNDDPWSCDQVLESATKVVACDDRIVAVNGHEMISCSYANPTPWRSPRELPENELYERINALAQQLERPESAIFNLHVPPYDSGLDIATELTDDFTPVFEGGQPKQIPVGSHAVRQLIEEYQPMLALHGHIHESRGQAQDRTNCCDQFRLGIQHRLHSRGGGEGSERRLVTSIHSWLSRDRRSPHGYGKPKPGTTAGIATNSSRG